MRRPGRYGNPMAVHTMVAAVLMAAGAPAVTPPPVPEGEEAPTCDRCGATMTPTRGFPDEPTLYICGDVFCGVGDRW